MRAGGLVMVLVAWVGLHACGLSVEGVLPLSSDASADSPPTFPLHDAAGPLSEDEAGAAPDGATPQPSCPSPQTRCGEACLDLTHDDTSCGQCGKACGAGEVCEASTCTPLCTGGGVLADRFGLTMVGCKGKIAFGSRATYCPASSHVCSAAEYVARRAGVKPTHSYWTNDELRYKGSITSCSAVVTGGISCSSSSTPMRVCAGESDPLGNDCNWVNCGFGSTSPNEYFGGCDGNTSAGVLCCK